MQRRVDDNMCYFIASGKDKYLHKYKGDVAGSFSLMTVTTEQNRAGVGSNSDRRFGETETEKVTNPLSSV